jgi:four helix bundle protein
MGAVVGDKIRSFRDLKVSQLSFSLQQEIFERSKGFPKDELFSLTNQIRRSSRSIGANQAEAWHKRRYVAHFVSKLSDSDAEQAESQHWLDTALQCKYLSVDEHKELMAKCMQIGRMLGKMMANPKPFCKPNNGSKEKD